MHGNLRAALEWSQTDSAELNFRLATALVGFWDARGYLTEGLDWLEKALGAWPEETGMRAEALGAAGWLTHRLGKLSQAESLMRDSIRVARATQRLRPTKRRVTREGGATGQVEKNGAMRLHSLVMFASL